MACAADPLPPVGKWTVGYEERMCTLSRTFGAEAAKVIEADGGVMSLRLNGVAAALKALKACEENPLRGWGANPAMMVKPSSPESMVRLFSRDTYSSAALRARASGNVVAMVTVDPNGKLKACRAVAGSGSTDLDLGTCRIIQQRARCAPAATGVTGDRWSVMSVRWVIG